MGVCFLDAISVICNIQQQTPTFLFLILCNSKQAQIFTWNNSVYNIMHTKFVDFIAMHFLEHA